MGSQSPLTQDLIGLSLMDAVTLLWSRFGCNPLEIPAIAILTHMSVFTRIPGLPQPLLWRPAALLQWISDLLGPDQLIFLDPTSPPSTC